MKGVRPQSGLTVRENFRGEGGEDFLAGREMEDRFHVPGRALGETLGQIRQPKARVPVARAIANDQSPAGRDPFREPGEEARLFVRRKIMQEIEEDDVAALARSVRSHPAR